MDISTITDKGQVTIPASLRRELGFEKGDKLIFAKNADGGMTITKVVDEDEAWHKFALKSFTEWDSPEDAVYDTLYDEDGNPAALHDKKQDDFKS